MEVSYPSVDSCVVTWALALCRREVTRPESIEFSRDNWHSGLAYGYGRRRCCGVRLAGKKRAVRTQKLPGGDLYGGPTRLLIGRLLNDSIEGHEVIVTGLGLVVLDVGGHIGALVVSTTTVA